MSKPLVSSIMLALAMTSAHNAAAQTPTSDSLIRFDMRRSAAVTAAGCLPHAVAHVSVKSLGEVEIMSISASGLPPDTGFDLFVIQLPNAPFGLSWYQGDMESDSLGRAQGTFIGRFNEETFIVAPGLVWRRWSTTRMRPQTRRPRPSTRSTSACGSIRRLRRWQRDARMRSRRSTASTTPAFRPWRQMGSRPRTARFGSSSPEHGGFNRVF